MNLDEALKLIKTVETCDFVEFSYQTDKIKMTIRRHEAYPQLAPAPIPLTPATQEPPARLPEKHEELIEVVAPMVGTFYRSPSPEADPFVSRGTKVKPGTVLCILEAMKLMNEIEAEVAGEVVQINAKNGQLVEYGQVLITLRPLQS